MDVIFTDYNFKRILSSIVHVLKDVEVIDAGKGVCLDFIDTCELTMNNSISVTLISYPNATAMEDNFVHIKGISS